MIPRSAPASLTSTTSNPFAPEEIAEFRAACEDIASRDGETGELAERMLRISNQLAAMDAEIQESLNAPSRA